MELLQALYEMADRPIKEEHLQLMLAGDASMQGDDEVEFTLRLAFEQVPAQVAGHLQRHPRVRLRELAEDRRQQRGHVLVRRAQPHAAGHPRSVQARHRLVVEREHPARIAGEGDAFGGELDAVGAALEERGIEHLLQAPHLQADRGLRPPDRVAGAREAAQVDGLEESAEELRRQIQHGIRLICEINYFI